MNEITGYLIHVNSGTAGPITIEKSLDSYYNILNCDCIDIVTRAIAGEKYDIVCDDEALLKDNPLISAIDDGLNPALCGNLFVVRFDGNEDLASLDERDIRHIEQYIRSYGTRKHPSPYPMLTRCNYY